MVIKKNTKTKLTKTGIKNPTVKKGGNKTVKTKVVATKAQLIARAVSLLFIANSIYNISRDPTVQESFSSLRSKIVGIVPKLNIILGEVFQNKYRIINQLGKGAVGTVFTGKNIKNDTDVIIKFVKISFPLLRNELDVLKHLKSIGCKYSACYIEHMYKDGSAIIIYSSSYKKTLTSSYPTDIAKKIIVNLITGLYFLHTNNIAHLDIKPENIIVSDHGDIQYIDFGVSCDKYCSLSSAGTPVYISPELRIKMDLHNSGFPQPILTLHEAFAGDIFSLGTVIQKIDSYRDYLTTEQYNVVKKMTLPVADRIKIDEVRQAFEISKIRSPGLFGLNFFGL